MKTYPTRETRHLVFRAAAGETLPDDLQRTLADEAVACGWLRASGVLRDVELRAFDGASASPGPARRIAGPVQVLSIEGSIGLERGEPSVGLRAVVARETDRGMEVLAGEIERARVVALEIFVTAFDDLALARAVDPDARVALLTDPAAPVVAAARPAPVQERREERPVAPERSEERAAAAPSAPVIPAPAKSSPGGWSDTIAASTEVEASKTGPARGALGGAIPARLARKTGSNEDSLVPEAGDMVEHFAFGPAEVMKSDGDRLHLRVGKDGGRLREIALEMLRVTLLPSDGPTRRFRLERKL